MRRVRVQLDFTIDVKADGPGIPEELIQLSWFDVISFGLTDEQWKVIDGVHRGRRKLTDVGDPCALNGMTETRWREDWSSQRSSSTDTEKKR